jgi:hypothetical protein
MTRALLAAAAFVLLARRPNGWMTLSNGDGTFSAVAGVTCSGAPTGSFATVNGIVTHC